MLKSKSSSPARGTATSGSGSKQRRRQEAAPATDESQKRSSSDGAFREIVESIVIAFVLAFLFRTFEAEAFVIPTGSMAPTLMGRHKDVVCPQCGFAYRISASEEVNSETGEAVMNGNHPVRVVAGTCPNCRYTMYLGPDNPQHESYPSYKGDRILVGKFPYDFNEPERWDVAVFKYPGGAETNFIKRLVGLPEETIKISHGDIFTKAKGAEDFTIARKPPAKIEAMLQPVHDNDYLAPELYRQGWPSRWNPLPAAADSGPWTVSDDHRTFRTDGSTQEEAWLSYRHSVPSYQDWQQLLAGGGIQPDAIRPQLITDFSAYNSGVDADSAYLAPGAHALGLHWVGDLVVEAVADVESDSGELILELIEGGRHFQCRIEVATGTATLSIDGMEDFRPTAKTKVLGPGGYHLRFANVDDQLLLWVNKGLVEFDRETTYPRLDNTVPTAEDLQPARLASHGAAVKFSHLKLRRDLYYIAVQAGGGSAGIIADFNPFGPPYQPMTPERIDHFLSDPSQWEVFRTLREVEFPLQKDQFLMLGDNSAASKDSRLWDEDEFFVKRDLLIGKALYIYWPHSWNRISGTRIWFPFFPNLARMGFVR
ncbi:MAG: hypothetical protein GXY83_02720 [Rhodopirellula sp.]|nr:hypothetical protein [Rhodopirellula sp.]